jgi:hypothetical protein
MIGQNRHPVTKRAPGSGTVQLPSSWPRPAPAKLRAMYEELRAKSEDRELRAMKMNKKESAMRKYFWEKFYLPNHYFYKHSDTIQLVKQLFLFSSWT